MKGNDYARGFGRGIPVGVGYFSVSFGFGAMAAVQGIKALDAAHRPAEQASYTTP